MRLYSACSYIDGATVLVDVTLGQANLTYSLASAPACSFWLPLQRSVEIQELATPIFRSVS